MLFGEPDGVKDQLPEDIHQYMIALVLQAMTGLEFAHELDQLGADCRVRLVMLLHASDGRHGGRFDLAL
jgi:hypothetical protein